MRTTPFAGPLLFEVMVLHATEKDPTRLIRRTYERGSALYDQIFADRGDAALEPGTSEDAPHAC